MTEQSSDVVERSEQGNIKSMATEQSDNGVSGPLGLWSFPLLSALSSLGSNQSEDNTVVVTEIHRDENGRIKSIEEVKQ